MKYLSFTVVITLLEFLLNVFPILAVEISTPIRLENSEQLIQIGDREPYEAKLTSITFSKPICIIALEIHTLQPLTGAEDIEITYNLCEELSASTNTTTWTLAHYTNKKNVFVLRHPILARKLAVVAGFERNRNSAAAMAILDVDIKQCNINTVFGSVQSEQERKCHKSSSSSQHHRHRSHSPVLKVSDAEVDQLLLGHISQSQPHRRNDSVEAVFIRTKRQTEKIPASSSNNTNTSGVCPLGFYGEKCDIPDCSSIRNCSNAGSCLLPNICKCSPNYFGADCSQCSGWFCNQCDFFCVHGQCDAITKSCRCRKGWSGAACDICINKNCSTEPMVKMILPQTAEWINENEYVYVHGTDLPKPDDMRYHCLFGGISTAGNWLSSELIRCSIPSRAQPGKHVFNVIPYRSKAYVPNENSKTVHFTFYIPCDFEKCQGYCFGPLCLCNNVQAGQNCENKNELLQNRTEELKDQSAKEGELYVVQIPTQSSTAEMKVFSTISDLDMDPFKRTVTWRFPKGNVAPYNIDAHLIDEKTDLNVRWNLIVEPSYTPLTGKVGKTGINNGYLLKGFIEYVNGSTNLSNAPILLEILSSSNPNAVLESFEITSTSSSSFSHLFYPFSGTKETETFTVRAKHPGKKNDTTNCATWTVKRLQVKTKKQSIKIENGTATTTYTVNAKAISCPNFDVTIIKPSDLITVGSFDLGKDKVAVTFVTASNADLPKVLNVTIAFICDKFSGVTVKQQFLSLDKSAADIQISPKTLEFYTSASNAPQFTLLKIEINSLPQELDESLISDTNILPFYVVASNPPYLNRPTIYRNGSKIELLLGLSQTWNANVGEGTLYLPNAKEPLIRIPYQIKSSTSNGIELIVTAKGFVSNETNVIDYPLDVTIKNINGQQLVRRMIYLNVPSEFYPLNSGYYQISIQSFTFDPMTKIFQLTPSNNNFETYLNKKRQYQFVFNGKRIKTEAIGGGDVTLPPSPEVIIEPSIFYSSNLNQDLFVNLIFKESPSNVTAFIGFDEQKENGEFILEKNVSINEAMKAPSGYRSMIKINRNAKFVSKNSDYLPSYCNIVKQSVPFYYAVDGYGRNFEGSVNYIVDKRISELDKAVICESESNAIAIPQMTSIVYDCAAAKILECRAFYQPIQSCGAGWNTIPDDTVSIHTYALFMNLKADCKLSDVELKTVQSLIECISSLDIDCPLAKPTESAVVPTTPSPFSSLLNQMKTISSLTQSLHGFFPALSTLESQLIDFPNYMADFLHHFEMAFPSSDFTNIRSKSWFDSFYSVISDSSELGPAITFTELESFPTWKDGRNLIIRWNETYEELKGEEFELMSPESKESRILLLRKLTEKADKLKSLARQFAAKEPFSMLHDILATIFGRVDYTSSNATQECAKAIGFIQSGKIRESEEFDVSIVITNVMDKQVLQNLRFQLEMLHSTPTGNYSFRKYRIGPLFYSGGIPSYLAPQKPLTVSWKIHPVFDRRLTEAIKEQPNVILTFDLNNKRKVQRIRIPEITILPDRHLRIYALAFPEVFPRSSETQPFNLALHVMNSGFSTLKNLEFVEISPWLMEKEKQANANFRINSVSVDGKFVGYLPKVTIKEIQSGKTSIVSITLTSLGGQSAKFKNCSVNVFVDGRNIPENFDYKFFFVQEIVSSSSYILSDKEPDDYKANLFYFNPISAKIRNLHQIQLTKEIPSEEQQESQSYYSILTTFERLLSPEEMQEAASSEGLKQTESSVYGRIQYPDNLKNGQQLVRVYEIGPGGIRRHFLDLNNTWVARKGEVSELNFIDPQALPPALASELTYEFIFAKAEDFNAPYFTQHYYKEQIPENMIIQPFTVIGKAGAQSPEGSKVNYSLVSQEKTESFVINTKTGEVILVSDSLPSTNQSSICFNVIVTDSTGRKSAVPYEILLPSTNDTVNVEKQECNIFQTDTPITYHEFTGDRSKLRRMEFEIISTATPFPTSNLGDEVTLSPEKEIGEITEILTTTTSAATKASNEVNESTVSLLSTTMSPITVSTGVGNVFYTIQPSTTSESWEQTKITDDDGVTKTATDNGNLPTEVPSETLFPLTDPTQIYTLPTEDYDFQKTTQAVRIRTTPKIIHETDPDDYLQTTTRASEINTVADWYTEENIPSSEVEGQSSATRSSTSVPPTSPSMIFTQFYTHRPTVVISKLFPTPSLFTPKPSTGSPNSRVTNTFVNYMSTTLPPTTASLPIATRMILSSTPSLSSSDLLGQIQSSGFMTPQQPVGDISASMVDTACRLRTTKPIWAVVCDMAKTVKVEGVPS